MDDARRRFLQLLAAAGASLVPAALSPVAAAKEGHEPRPRIGLALGAGGASGLAHIPMLEAIDGMGLAIDRIAGSSIGAIVGALYASGLSGRQIRALVEQSIISPDEPLLDQLVSEDAMRWVDFVEVELGKGGLLSADGFLAFMYEQIRGKSFADLEITFEVVTADLWAREQVVLDGGDLLSAIEASMALPGVFEPVERDGRVLVDGGTFNPVPYDLLLDDCDIVVAIDVIGRRTPPESGQTGYFDTLFNSAKVMQAAIMQEKRRHRSPDIYLAPPITDIRALEFYRASEVFEQAEPARQELEARLAALVGAWIDDADPGNTGLA